ncbi:hypothetical protein HU200_063892 [Digitaria exilis]|uniref:Trichome birefringence-like N-terminal domain-containing protein n=1 Tax=Digitaria exilis TaxID=1010633 RepID=A0A835DYP6_9POAL|nr:hypothetical protein HU200_063892 [Digitaria exilis]
MKFHEIKLPYTIHCAIPATLLAACLVILAVVIILPNDRLPLLPPPVVSDVDDNVSGNLSCNIFKGEWVPDDPGATPRYTTETCPVIHGHYDCTRYGRPDLEFLRWRWRPDRCELPRLDAARFLRAARGRSMAFVGDSLARNQMHSLVCLLARAETPSPWTNAATASQQQHASFSYRFERHGFTVASFWSPFLVRAVETDTEGVGMWSLHLDEPDDAGWAACAGEFDYVVISGGSWFFRPSMFHEHGGRLVGCNGCLAPNVTDLTLRYSLRKAFRTALRAAATAGDGERRRRRDRTVVVRTLSPSHYENGRWDGDGDCARTRPLRRGGWEMNAVEKEMYAIQAEEFAAAARRETEKGEGVRMLLLDATEAMAMRPDAHPSRYRLWQPDRFNVSRDCLHWCLPGAMDACNDMLLHMLLH